MDPGREKNQGQKDLHDGEAIWCYADTSIHQGEFEDGKSLFGESFFVSFPEAYDQVLLGNRVLQENGLPQFTEAKRLRSVQNGASLASGAAVEGRWDGVIEFASTGPNGLVSGTMLYEKGLPVIAGPASDGSWVIEGTGGFHTDDPYEEMIW